MRNYLRPEQVKKLTKQQRRAQRQRWASSSLAISVLLAASTIFMAKFVFAAVPTQKCVPASDHMHILSDNPSGDYSDTNAVGSHGSLLGPSIGSWQNGNFFFKVYNFYINNDDTANSGDSCSVSFHIRTNTPEFMWNGQRPVDVRLGVPNMGVANNAGAWAAGQTLFGNVAYDRPPQYSSNFRSWAAFADDGGMATIGGSPRNPNFHTLWCQSFNPGAVNAGGQGLLAGDGSLGCPSLGTALAPLESADITAGNLIRNGTGFMFTADNCHFANANTGGIVAPPISDKDGDGSWVDRPPFGPCDSQTNQTKQNMWYWNSMQALANVTAVTNPATPKDNLTLKDYIGCNGGALCDGRQDPLDNFDLHEYSRNHLINPAYANWTCPQITAGGIDACATSAQTIVTFAYPVPATLNVTKTPSGCYFPENVPMDPAHCPMVSSDGSYVITLQESTVAGASNPLLATTTVKDVVPSPLTYVGINSSCIDFATGNPLRAPTVSGNTLSWDLNLAERQLLATGWPLEFCYNVHIGPRTLPSPQPFVNAASASGIVGSTNLPATPGSDFTTNYIVSSLYPYLNTAAGDVHSGGTLCSSTSSPPTAATRIQGQSQAGGNLSQGSYVVSAGGSVPNNVNNFNGAAGALTGKAFYGVCRPDLVGAAITAEATHPSGLQVISAPVATVNANLSAWLNAPAGSYPNGLLIHAQGLGRVTIPNATISNNITVWADDFIVVNATINYSSAIATSTKNLGSFGVIAGNYTVPGSTGNIGIVSGATSINGFLYSINNIATCTTSAGTPYNGSADPTLGINKLKAACNVPLTLNGLMSSYTFDFNRVPPVSAVAPVDTEQINYTGLILLAPPPVFDLTIPGTKSSSGIQILPPQY